MAIFSPAREGAGPRCWMCCLKGCRTPKQKNFHAKTPSEDAKTPRRVESGAWRVKQKAFRDSYLLLYSLRLCAISLRLCVKLFCSRLLRGRRFSARFEEGRREMVRDTIDLVLK